jgi:phage portal protein BeeE
MDSVEGEIKSIACEWHRNGRLVPRRWARSHQQDTGHDPRDRAFFFAKKKGSSVKVREQLRELWRQAIGSTTAASAGTDAERKTLALPAVLSAVQFSGQSLPKPTPANLRRFAETPVVRRAINVIKDRIAAMDWQVRVRRGCADADTATAANRISALRRTLEEPNEVDSFRTLIEQVIEDALTGGYGSIEIQNTGDPERPAMLWPVDGASIRINPRWDGQSDSPRYAQVAAGQMDAAGIELRDNQLIYVRMNPRSFTPFGLGPLEVAFESVNQFLSAHRFAGKLAANSVAQYAIWLNEATPAQHDRLIRWWQDEANAFGLPPLLLGLESDVNRSTAIELADEAFRGAILPLAQLLAGHITRDLFAKCIGWREFEFVFNDLNARDEATELAVQVQLLQAGVLTVDEVRAIRGLAPLTEIKRVATSTSPEVG